MAANRGTRTSGFGGSHAVVETEATSMQSRCSLQIKGMIESFNWLEETWRLLKETS